MKTCFVLAFAFLGAVMPLAAQTSDFPGASDFPEVHRPPDSFLIGAKRVDLDEFAIPVGPVERGGPAHPGKALHATGSIDYLAYSGPKTTSSLATYTGLAAQLRNEGFTEVYSCSRASCGSAFTLDNLLSQPLVDSIHTGDWGHYLIDDLDSTTDDSRYGVFQRGGVYYLVLASLGSGYRSGSLLIRVAQPPAASVLAETPAAADSSAQGNAQSSASSATQSAQQTLRSKARGWLTGHPQ
ncbi:MAG: hypothetical protein PW735_02890 [Acidobacteriaceae bacterium]|nr:hypothetical protein [Acidobacteriaceae bacterium]